MKIQINDEQLNRGDEVLEKDVQVSIIEAEEQTIKTLDSKGDVVEVTLNVMKPAMTTSLQALDDQINTQEHYKQATEASLAQINAELTKLRAMKASVTVEVTKAIAERPAKPVETPVEEIIP